MFIFLSIKHSKCQRYSLQWIRFNIDLPSNVVPMISGRRKALYSECPRCFLLLLLPFLVHSPFHVLVEPTENRKYIRKYPSILNCIINKSHCVIYITLNFIWCIFLIRKQSTLLKPAPMRERNTIIQYMIYHTIPEG